MRVLVTGGVRSGKSRHAESLLGAEDRVTYVAAGPRYDDADWAARIAAHQDRRPATWRHWAKPSPTRRANPSASAA